MAVLLDLHVHTKLGSLDSSVDPSLIVESARRSALAGVVVTEHYRVWTTAELSRWSTPDVRLFAGAEVATDVGHVIAIGFPQYPASRTIRDLCSEAREAGAALLLAHPFRSFFDSQHHWLSPVAGPAVPAAAAKLATCCSAIEIDNSGCTEDENRLAEELRQHMGLGAVGGSDAHVEHHIGRAATRFSTLPQNTSELARILRCSVARYGAARSGSYPEITLARKGIYSGGYQ